MKKFRRPILIAAFFCVAGIAAFTLNFIAGAATVLDDTFADGISTNQSLPNSAQVFKSRTGTTRTDAVGSVEFDLTNAGGSDAYWAHFTAAGAPVTLGVGDSVSFAGTFSLTGFQNNAQDIRFGLLDSKGTRNTADLTSGQSSSAFGDDTGYAAQFYASGTGNPFILYRRDVTNPVTTNIFSTMATSAGFQPITGSGATARQALTNATPYTFNYTVQRTSATTTLITISVTGGALSNLSYAGTETSNSPYTSFDWFSMRVGGNNFATKIKFTRFTVNYTPAAPVITTQPAPTSQSVAVGANVTYSVAATGSELSYQWQKDGNDITGNASATTANLTITNAQTTDAGVYTVKVSNSGGTATSDPVNLTVTSGPTDPAPQINTQPQNTSAVVGSSASLSVGAIGSNLSYQWFKNNAIIPGANSATLNFPNVQTSDAADYKVNVSNSGGTVTSDTAHLTVVSSIAATAFEPTAGATNICTDTPLKITFNQTPKVGTSGRLRVYKADGTLVDTIDMAAATQTKNSGGVNFNYYPIIINGNTANIYLHQQLAYNETFYITIEPGVLTDASNVPFAGFSDANTFRLTTKAAAPAAGANVLTVAANGAGDFCTIQAAVDFVPANNAQRVIVNVKNGTYTEIVYIPSNKPLITVKGESRDGTIQQYANNNNLNGAVSGNYRASFGVDAADFALENITLHNITPQNGSQAEALRSNGLRATINSVNLLSFQDTLLTQKSAFVNNSYIEGDVDFMWGNGATFYKNTELKMLRENLGYYTQIRNTAANYGNVYLNCKLTKGAGVTNGSYLGRIDPDDFPYSQVVFINSQMDSHITPVGWLFNSPTNAVTAANYPNIRYWEYNTTDLNGNAVDCSQRHPISRNSCNNPLTQAEVDFYSNPANIAGFTPQEKLSAIVSLGNTTQIYDGTPRAVSVTTDPANLPVVVTYNGSSTVPTNAGTYTVVATVSDANYQGSATGTLTISKAAAAVTLSNLTQDYDGTPKAATVTTNPAGLNVSVTYNGSANAPTAIGNYTVTATITDANYQGSATGNLNIKSTVKAFPTAEGAGAYTIGGRGGDVYHVTNLNDSGAGSLRNGVTTATGARTIIFDLSGTIYLTNDLTVNKSFLTFAGQTAPGDGITVAGRTFSVSEAQHVIVRYMRFRAGDINCPSMQGDAFWVDKSKDVIVDHVSASWSIDETLSVTESDRVSVQWSFITESLKQSCHVKGAHGYGSLIRYGDGRISYHHNLYAHHLSRNPRVGDDIKFDFVNNVVYDWGSEAGYSGPIDEGVTKINYVGNYFIAGPTTPSSKRTRAFDGFSVNTLIYQTGNVIDGNLNGAHDGTNTGWAMFVGTYTQQSAPFEFAAPPSNDFAAPPIENNLSDIGASDANAAYTNVLALAGNSFKRDAVDTRVANEVKTETGTQIDSQTQVGGYPVLNSLPAPNDTDQDGIPDTYENSNGLNANDAGDAALIASNGYSNLENYLNVAFYAPTAANASVGGRALTSGRRGISGAAISLTDTATGETKIVLTNPFGYYSFDSVVSGKTYLIKINSKKYGFDNASQLINVNDSLAEINFVANR